MAALAFLGGDEDDDSNRGTPGGLWRAERPEPSHGPNVVVVMADDQEVRSTRVMPFVTNELARHGTVFKTSVTTTPLCCPSRASFLTGQYAHNHGVLSNGPPDGGYEALEHSNTLAVWLQRAGYRTAQIGRYLNNYAEPFLGGDLTEVPPGWDRWQVPVANTEFRMYGYTLNEDGELREYGYEPRDYQTDVVARKAVRFVRDAAGRRPFFLSADTLAPHDEGVLEDVADAPRNPRPAPRHLGRFDDEPLPRPPSFNERAIGDKPVVVERTPILTPDEVDRLRTLHRSRLESLLSVDALVADLTRALRLTGELQDTLLIYTSDNGYLLGEHRLHAKEHLYEEVIRVPLIMRGPGFPEGVTRSQPVANIDLAPTILDLAGHRPPHELDGTSLLPIARDPEAEVERAILVELLTEPEFSAVRTRDFAYAEHEHGATELYDIERDPHQLHSLARDPSYADARLRLTRLLDRLRKCSGASCQVSASQVAVP